MFMRFKMLISPLYIIFFIFRYLSFNAVRKVPASIQR